MGVSGGRARETAWTGRDPAGTRAFDWLDAFLPIGDAGTDCSLIVDLREGISEMLADVADSLTLGQPALQDHGRRMHAATPFPVHPPDPVFAWASRGWV
ncbi:hypothetical protein EV645_3108 [Kribbella rubisoli]|uniref:Uncharacterized protein n=1 Tax=Kribbella rubisoli TaxID=3075929 RepID=A0A4Q7WYI3_9ACTN|nr:hypothetical protein [Kribbella rubisoli]RZU15570.1 hypothetical protein EV645_3108 [Kribbella rubisoli]